MAVVAHKDREQLHAETIPAWREWLEANHRATDGVWLVSWKSATGKSRISYDDSVVEALAVGWVDGLHVTLDEQRSALWFAPRKTTSPWSRPNKDRIDLLEREGRLLPAGRVAVEVARANGAWGLLDDADNLVVTQDLALALALYPGAREQWDAFPPSARRAILGWIALAKTAPTRAKRINETAERASRGERANQWPRA
jgi:uncharacterized protein YdeI (YjbR/CyaY-like superfamily)